MARPITLYPREREMLRARIVDCLVEGLSGPEIAQRLGISLATVEYHIRYLRDVWRSHNMDYISRERAELIADQKRIIQEAWQAWELTSSPREGVVQPGREQYLKTIQESWNLIAKVTGMEAPKKLSVEGLGSRTFTRAQIEAMSTEELMALRERWDRFEQLGEEMKQLGEGEGELRLPGSGANMGPEGSDSSSPIPDAPMVDFKEAEE